MADMALSPVPNGGGFNLGSLWGEAKDLIKYQIAATNNYTGAPPTAAPGTPANAPAATGAPTGRTLGDSLTEVLGPLAAVYGADQANKRLNANQPVWLYVLLGFGTVGMFIVLWRPKKG